MTLPNTKVAKILSEDSELMDMLNAIRAKKLTYNPVFTSTPKDDFNNAPWIRITNIPYDAAIYADDKRAIEFHRVQVDFWVEKKDKSKVSEIIDRIYDVLEEHEYERYYLSIHDDADDNNLVMVTGNFEGYRERN
ncbi:hypothetical protein [Ligilactobacillus equi]|uniref:Uncharacterized protein n=1 Tax=Ligilactobacillus equi DSM 15833 = JCM 10991 TaxID=1423740 RepID=A0A0R1T617_9LACO|nr:hypothetical protein [Ligilactobacillus equi]KRL76617.1 hypothetical protein FC36_GL001855 [Ligilactobacillus equi DSM 15833 = JCM 10991]